jgi:hypothetical protein
MCSARIGSRRYGATLVGRKGVVKTGGADAFAL